jgi:hypothetical protein
MKLDFSALSQSAGIQRGQLGTVGTQAFMRVSLSPSCGDAVGTGGDKAAAAVAADRLMAVPEVCPPVPPPCPQVAKAENLNGGAVSPVSPLVPTEKARAATAALITAAPVIAQPGDDLGAADSDAWCWPHSNAMNSAEIEATVFRLQLFARLDMGEAQSEKLTDLLVIRDRQLDDRRLCLECSHLGDRGRCLAAAAGRLPSADRRLEPVPDVLQRCPAFGLRKGLT